MADQVLSFFIIERPGMPNQAEAVNTNRIANWKEIQQQILQFFPQLCADNLVVHYWDEEDYVTVSCQEELEEAFQVCFEKERYRTLYVRMKDDLSCSCFHQLSPAKMPQGATPPLERKSDQRTSENIQPPELPEEEDPAYLQCERVPKDMVEDTIDFMKRHKTKLGFQSKYLKLQASDDTLQDNFADCDESESATGERMMIPGASSGANVIAIEMPEIEYHGTETAEPAEIAETGEMSSKTSRDAETGFWVLPHEKSSRRPEKTKRKNASLRTAEDRAYLHNQLLKLREHKQCKEKSQEQTEDRKKKHRTNPLSEETFYHSMRKFESHLKKDVAKDVAKTVAKKVKHSVIKALTQHCDELQAARQAQADTTTRTGFIHEEIFCDHCDREIVGIRYMCGNCENYDLCEQCENIQPAVHDFAHVFIKIRTPCQNAGIHNGVRTPLLKKVIYKEEDKEGEEDPKEDVKPAHDVNEDWGNLDLMLPDWEQSTASVYQTVAIPPLPQISQLRPVLGRNEDTGVSEERLSADELNGFCIVPNISFSQQELGKVYQEEDDHVESGPDTVEQADAVEGPLTVDQPADDCFQPLVDIIGAGFCEDAAEEEKSGSKDLSPSMSDDHPYAQKSLERVEKDFVAIPHPRQMNQWWSDNSLAVNVGSDSLELNDISVLGSISDESSSTDEEFTVIVPDCFDISKPLPVHQNQEVPSAPPDEITIQWESPDSIPRLEGAKEPENADGSNKEADDEANKEADDEANEDADDETDLSDPSTLSGDTVESCLPAAVSNAEKEEDFVKVSAQQEENTVSKEADTQQKGACAALDDAALVEADAASQEQAPETGNPSDGATHVSTDEEQLSELEEHRGAAAADSEDYSPQPAMMSNPLKMASNGLQHLLQTSKVIFRTLQGTDVYECKESTYELKSSDFKLPESTWQPSNKEYVPPKSNFIVPQSEFQMPKNSYTGPQSQVPSVAGMGGEYAGPLQRIREMGFFNNERILALLKKHGGDVQKTLDELIDETDNDWSQRRH